MKKKTGTQTEKFVLAHFRNGVYQGEMSYRAKQGFGVFSWDSGEFYYGLWNQDRMNGRGILFLPEGVVVRGVFRNDSLHGKAFIMLGGKLMLICQFLNGVLSGNVLQVMLNDSSGDYDAHNLRNGKRIRGFVMKEEYFMNYDFLRRVTKRKDKRGCHFETLDFQDGGMYFGMVKAHIPEGLGLFIYPDLKFHAGTYHRGLLHGLARINFGNGDVYDGLTFKGKMHGPGFFFNAESNEWVFGSFEEDECKEVAANGEDYPSELMVKYRKQLHQEFETFIDAETSSFSLDLAQVMELTQRFNDHFKQDNEHEEGQEEDGEDYEGFEGEEEFPSPINLKNGFTDNEEGYDQDIRDEVYNIESSQNMGRRSKGAKSRKRSKRQKNMKKGSKNKKKDLHQLYEEASRKSRKKSVPGGTRSRLNSSQLEGGLVSQEEYQSTLKARSHYLPSSNKPRRDKRRSTQTSKKKGKKISQNSIAQDIKVLRPNFPGFTQPIAPSSLQQAEEYRDYQDQQEEYDDRDVVGGGDSIHQHSQHSQYMDRSRRSELRNQSMQTDTMVSEGDQDRSGNQDQYILQLDKIQQLSNLQTSQETTTTYLQGIHGMIDELKSLVTVKLSDMSIQQQGVLKGDKNDDIYDISRLNEEELIDVIKRLNNLKQESFMAAAASDGRPSMSNTDERNMGAGSSGDQFRNTDSVFGKKVSDQNGSIGGSGGRGSQPIRYPQSNNQSSSKYSGSVNQGSVINSGGLQSKAVNKSALLNGRKGSGGTGRVHGSISQHKNSQSVDPLPKDLSLKQTREPRRKGVSRNHTQSPIMEEDEEHERNSASIMPMEQIDNNGQGPRISRNARAVQSNDFGVNEGLIYSPEISRNQSQKSTFIVQKNKIEEDCNSSSKNMSIHEANPSSSGRAISRNRHYYQNLEPQDTISREILNFQTSSKELSPNIPEPIINHSNLSGQDPVVRVYPSTIKEETSSQISKPKTGSVLSKNSSMLDFTNRELMNHNLNQKGEAKYIRIVQGYDSDSDKRPSSLKYKLINQRSSSTTQGPGITLRKGNFVQQLQTQNPNYQKKRVTIHGVVDLENIPHPVVPSQVNTERGTHETNTALTTDREFYSEQPSLNQASSQRLDALAGNYPNNSSYAMNPYMYPVEAEDGFTYVDYDLIEEKGTSPSQQIKTRFKEREGQQFKFLG